MVQLRNGSPACTEPCFITRDKKSKRGTWGRDAKDSVFAPKIYDSLIRTVRLVMKRP